MPRRKASITRQVGLGSRSFFIGDCYVRIEFWLSGVRSAWSSFHRECIAAQAPSENFPALQDRTKNRPCQLLLSARSSAGCMGKRMNRPLRARGPETRFECPRIGTCRDQSCSASSTGACVTCTAGNQVEHNTAAAPQDGMLNAINTRWQRVNCEHLFMEKSSLFISVFKINLWGQTCFLM